MEKDTIINNWLGIWLYENNKYGKEAYEKEYLFWQYYYDCYVCNIDKCKELVKNGTRPYLLGEAPLWFVGSHSSRLAEPPSKLHKLSHDFCIETTIETVMSDFGPVEYKRYTIIGVING